MYMYIYMHAHMCQRREIVAFDLRVQTTLGIIHIYVYMYIYIYIHSHMCQRREIVAFDLRVQTTLGI
jgi:hypothetical protein